MDSQPSNWKDKGIYLTFFLSWRCCGLFLVNEMCSADEKYVPRDV